MVQWNVYRYFGDGAESKKEKEDFELMIARTFDLIGAFIVSDFVPYLAFVTKLPGCLKSRSTEKMRKRDEAMRVMCQTSWICCCEHPWKMARLFLIGTSSSY
jgi:hypothetical protein